MFARIFGTGPSSETKDIDDGTKNNELKHDPQNTTASGANNNDPRILSEIISATQKLDEVRLAIEQLAASKEISEDSTTSGYVTIGLIDVLSDVTRALAGAKDIERIIKDLGAARGQQCRPISEAKSFLEMLGDNYDELYSNA